MWLYVSCQAQQRVKLNRCGWADITNWGSFGVFELTKYPWILKAGTTTYAPSDGLQLLAFMLIFTNLTFLCCCTFLFLLANYWCPISTSSISMFKRYILLDNFQVKRGQVWDAQITNWVDDLLLLSVSSLTLWGREGFDCFPLRYCLRLQLWQNIMTEIFYGLCTFRVIWLQITFNSACSHFIEFLFCFCPSLLLVISLSISLLCFK